VQQVLSLMLVKLLVQLATWVLLHLQQVQRGVSHVLLVTMESPLQHVAVAWQANTPQLWQPHLQLPARPACLADIPLALVPAHVPAALLGIFPPVQGLRALMLWMVCVLLFFHLQLCSCSHLPRMGTQQPLLHGKVCGVVIPLGLIFSQ
jgi:hypothetical protein